MHHDGATEKVAGLTSGRIISMKQALWLFFELHLNPSRAGRWVLDLPAQGIQTELTLVVGCIPRWFTWPQTATHPSSNGGDTQSRNLYKSTLQETWLSDVVSHTRFFLYKFLAPNTAQLYSTQETCMHVTRMVSSDWSAAYRCHYFHFVVFMLLTIYCTKLI